MSGWKGREKKKNMQVIDCIMIIFMSGSVEDRKLSIVRMKREEWSPPFSPSWSQSIFSLPQDFPQDFLITSKKHYVSIFFKKWNLSDCMSVTPEALSLGKFGPF